MSFINHNYFSWLRVKSSGGFNLGLISRKDERLRKIRRAEFLMESSCDESIMNHYQERIHARDSLRQKISEQLSQPLRETL